MSVIVPIEAHFEKKREIFFLKLSKIIPAEVLDVDKEIFFQSGTVPTGWLDYIFDPKNNMSDEELENILSAIESLSDTRTNKKARVEEPPAGRKSVSRDRDHPFFKPLKLGK